jgi:hypothetical protein
MKLLKLLVDLDPKQNGHGTVSCNLGKDGFVTERMVRF